MKLFFDCEFTGLRKDTTLISLGIVDENGKKFYAEFTDYDERQCGEWIKENVIKNLHLYPIPWCSSVYERLEQMKRDGYIFPQMPLIPTGNSILAYPWAKEDENGNVECVGEAGWVESVLKIWISQFDSIQFVSDVCHYDFILLIDLLTNGGTALDLPDGISAVCHDINSDIARRYGISEREAFDKSREEIISELCDKPVMGNKHNALYDAEVIREIYGEIG